MKNLRLLLLVPLLGLDRCPPGAQYVFVEVEGSLIDEECVDQFFDDEEVPMKILLSCAVDPEHPVQDVAPIDRCHPSGDIGLRTRVTCTLGDKGAVQVDVKFSLLYDGCTAEDGVFDTVSIVAPPGGDAETLSAGASRDDSPDCSIFGPPQDGTGWLLVDALNTPAA